MSKPRERLEERLARLIEQGRKRQGLELFDDGHLDETGKIRRAAVLIAFTDRERPGILLTRRPQTMRDHPGQVAFPGGKIDAGEDAPGAALREAREELGIDPAQVRLCGTSDPYRTGTGFDITPVIGVLPPDLPIRPHPHEVEAWFEAPADLLLRPEGWRCQEVLWRGKMRRYLEMDYKGFRIWGVTAAILANLARRIAIEELVDDR